MVALLVSVFGGWPRQLQGADPAAVFRWKHLGSPFGPSVMVVAEAGGDVIGFEALIRWPVTAGGRTVMGARGVDIAVDPAHRGRGVAGALIRAATAGIADDCAFAFSNPNAMSDPMLVKHGRRPVGPFEVLVRPRRPLRLMRRGRLAPGDGGAAAREPRPTGGHGAGRHRGAVAALLRDAPRPAGRFATALDPAYLRWRYGRSADYRAIRVRPGGALRGLRHLPRRAQAAPPGPRRVCEVLAAGDDARVVRRLLRGVLRAAPVDYAV